MKFYLKTFLIVAFLTVAAYFLHSWWIVDPAIPLARTYIFLGTATFVTVSALRFVHFYVPEKLGYAFMAAIFVKCGLAIVCFPELIVKNSGLNLMEVLGFLVPYFIFLFIEVVIVIKWLNDN
ncbi:hypothetical protein AAU57_02435 [Nonlabens sp. YIK11]|uniref:hypothetical protein n=1 Tax=Nonlabens sp. YIK11 TaxID=1453349 RepID=UPI0006DC7221|nr:hypothetical protein [Nonlabens sp. YIK11]KQC32310.1 hypothetical protein AAU57_02435 [Nonlabens sp. YIK11]